MADLSLFIFHTVNSETRNKETQINKVYFIDAFRVILSSLPCASENNEKNELAMGDLY